MLRTSLYNLLLLIIIVSPVAASGTVIPEDLRPLGEGEAYYLKFIKVYDATLFGSSNSGQNSILSRDVSKCLHLEYAVDVKGKDFIKAAQTVLNRQFSEEQLLQVKQDIDALHQGYLDVKSGDTYTLCYDSRISETTLSLNGDTLVSIDSPEFAEIYFSIWLGENRPLDNKLRNDLLTGIKDEGNGK